MVTEVPLVTVASHHDVTNFDDPLVLVKSVPGTFVALTPLMVTAVACGVPDRPALSAQ
nr:MAG TPA: hypothetical protein [Caudoviricetes sp.]